MMKRWRWLAAAGLLALVAAFVLTAGRPLAELVLYQTHVSVEKVLGQTPERRLAAYFAAIRRGDRQAALAEWTISDGASDDLLARREAMTDELLRLGPDLQYAVIDVDWWSNCCEPSPAKDPGGAGVARMRVSVTGGREPEARLYTVDITTPATYWGLAAGQSVRRWVLRDVYRPDETPLAFGWPGVAAALVQSDTLSETTRDQTQWLTYDSASWPLSFRYPPGWSVVEIVYARPDYGPVIRIASGDQVLELVRRGSPPPALLSQAGVASIGPLSAERYQDASGAQPGMVLLVPLESGDSMAYARIEVRRVDDAGGYVQVFEAILGTVDFH